MKRWIPLLMVAGLWIALFTTGRAWGQAACMTGSPAASATCSAGISYGVSVGASSIPFLARDLSGARNCLQLYADPSNTGNVCVAFANDAAVASLVPPNCVQLKPGDPYAIFNLPNGNGQFLVPNGNLAAISVSGTNNLMYTYCR